MVAAFRLVITALQQLLSAWETPSATPPQVRQQVGVWRQFLSTPSSR